MISPNELRALAAAMVESGVSFLKTSDVEIQVWPAKLVEAAPAKPLTAEEQKAAERARVAYDEALQYAHVEGLPRT